MTNAENFISITCSAKLKNWLQRQADKEKRSLSQWIRLKLEELRVEYEK